MEPIPKRIHLIYKNEQIPDKYRTFLAAMKEMNPAWEINIHVDHQSRLIISENMSWLLPYYDGYEKDIQRTDIFRIAVVYLFGGFYLDLDMLCLKNMDDLCRYQLVLGEECTLTDRQRLDLGHEHSFRVANYMFGSAPRHPFWLDVLQEAAARSGRKILREDDVLDTTGPGLLTDMYHLHAMKYPAITMLYNKSGKCVRSCNRVSCHFGLYAAHFHLGHWRWEQGSSPRIQTPFEVRDSSGIRAPLGRQVPAAIHVSSEIGKLRKMVLHSPDSGLGMVVPSRAQDWLFDDIIHLESLRRHEYDYYVKILLYFLDPDKVQKKLATIDAPEKERSFYKPETEDFHGSRQVLEIQMLLADILEVYEVRLQLIASVSSIERCPYLLQERLMHMKGAHLASTFITGTLENGEMIFSPLPNFIFTRDIGIIINDHILLNRPAKTARYRESILAKYIFYHHPIFASYRENIIEIPDNRHHFLLSQEQKQQQLVTLEGGDVMVVSPEHLLIGWSERTTYQAINSIIKLLFEKKVVSKITVIKIPHERSFMHIDTIFTQVKRNVWVLLDTLSGKAQDHFSGDDRFSLPPLPKEAKVTIMQLCIDKPNEKKYFHCLEELLNEISSVDLKSAEPTKFIYSGNSEFPYNEREQGTDSCNLLALKEGVVVGYDRNDKTAASFRENGFKVVRAADLLEKFEKGELSPENIEDTLILIPSAELSRAGGGSHCMCLPVLREPI